MSNLLINTAKEELSSIRSTTENAGDVVVFDIKPSTNDARVLGMAPVTKKEIILNTSTMMRDALDAIVEKAASEIKVEMASMSTARAQEPVDQSTVRKAMEAIDAIDSTASVKIEKERSSLEFAARKVTEEMVHDQLLSTSDANEVIEQTKSILAGYVDLGQEVMKEVIFTIFMADEIASDDTQTNHDSSDL